MSDDDDILGPYCRSELTRHVLYDPGLFAALSERDGAERGAGAGERLALRLWLDRAIRQAADWPSERDYAQIADDLEGLGCLEPAAALRQLAGTDELVDQARRRWRDRYVYRGRTTAELELEKLTEQGAVEFDDRDPVPGIDGASYQRGYIPGGAHAGHVVIVRGRGQHELIAFGDDEPGCEQWLATRGPLASAPFEHPPAARNSRLAHEERLLAAMLADAASLARHRERFPADTFTADGRYEIYAAMTALSASGQRWYPSQVAGQALAHRDRLPAGALAVFGGDTMPWLRNYLERLTATTVSAASAESAALVILAEDAWFRRGCEAALHSGYGAGRTAPRCQPASDPGQCGTGRASPAAMATPPQPPPGPDAPAGPALRM